MSRLREALTPGGSGRYPRFEIEISRRGSPPSMNSRPPGTRAPAIRSMARTPASRCRPSSAPTLTANARSYRCSSGSSTRSSIAPTRTLNRPASIRSPAELTSGRIARGERSTARTWPPGPHPSGNLASGGSRAAADLDDPETGPQGQCLDDRLQARGQLGHAPPAFHRFCDRRWNRSGEALVGAGGVSLHAGQERVGRSGW